MPNSTGKECSAPNCPKSGMLSCSGCADASYCSRDCQKLDWPFHKKTCYSSQKSNCFLLRAVGPEDGSPTNVMNYVDMFNLESYGNEGAEQRELARRLGIDWSQVQEIGKFYNQAGADTWYYFIYGPNQARAKSSGLPKNEIASSCIAQVSQQFQLGPVYGDVAIIRSAPSHYMDVCPETFTKLAVVKDIRFNMVNDAPTVSQGREMSRAVKNATADSRRPAGATGMHFMSRPVP